MATLPANLSESQGAAVLVRPVPMPGAAFTEEQLALLKNLIAKDCSTEELALFGMICQRTGLDPFARQIYAIKRYDKTDVGKMTIQVSIDGYRLIADRTGCYAGNDAAVYDTETDDHPAWAKVTVYKLVGGHARPFTATARWKEYYPTHPKQRFMWDRMGYLLLGKVCEALALRKAFPQELSGLYTHEEMQQAELSPVETGSVVTGEIVAEGTPGESRPARSTSSVVVTDHPLEVQREALKLEIKVALAEVVRPLSHAGLFKAVIYHSFGCAWDTLPEQDLAVLDQGMALFRHLCTELGAHGKDVLCPETPGQMTLAPDQWVAQEVRRLAQESAIAA